MRLAIGLFLRSRRRQIVLAALLGVAGVALLVAGRDVAGYGQEILVNLGASLIMVALSFVVFDPIFEDMRRNAVEQHRTLNHDQLVSHIAAAQDDVDILETWTGLLEERNRDRFLAALTHALHNGVEVRILLLDPESAAAEQRAEELHQTQVPVLIMDNLRHLYHLRRTLDPLTARQLQVRVYDASPRSSCTGGTRRPTSRSSRSVCGPTTRGRSRRSCPARSGSSWRAVSRSCGPTAPRGAWRSS